MEPPHEVIFVHEGKPHDPGAPIGLLPMGLLSMADWLEQRGMRARIVHHAIEKAVDPGFDVCAYLDSRGARLACLDLHWHQQSPGVIELARRIKEALPSIRIVLGGYTASAFAPEIMERFAFVDFVIRGDGERPLALLVEHIDGGTLEHVPNLVWREDGRVRGPARTHVNSAADLGRYSFTGFHLLRHAGIYNQAGMMEGRINTGAVREPGIFYCNLGRGCPYGCLFCGGSARAQQMMSGRTECVYRPVEAMIRDLSRMREHNLDTWYNTFHPSPDETRFLELFERIREERIDISMIHECLHIPSEGFVEQFAATFGRKSRMDFVLLSGSEELRRRNKENFFGNAELLDCLGLLHRRGIAADLCFLTGLPHEERSHVDDSIAFVREARKRHPEVGVNAEVLAIEPLSTMSLEPEACGIRARARTFLDYVRGHAEPVFTGYEPGSYDAREASRLARSIAGPGARRASGRDLVQLHDVSLWDGVMGKAYGLGIPSLVSHARSIPRIDARFAFEHRRWHPGGPAGREPGPDDVAGAVLEAGPVLAGFTMVTWSESLFLDAIRTIKREAPGTLVAVGGPLATGHGPALMEAVPEIDFLAAGYGERAFVSLLEAIRKGRAPRGGPGLYVRDGERVTGSGPRAGSVLAPDEIPSAFRSGLVDLSQCRTMHVEWSRGCSFGCRYCSWANALRAVKLSSRDRILDDIAFASGRGISRIAINSSTINADRDTLEALCEAMASGSRGTPITFTAYLRHELVDEEQLEILATVPFESLVMGLQTDDPRGLRAVGRPPLDRDRFERVVESISRLARPAVQIISGLPGDTLDRLVRRLDWLEGLGCDITVFPLQVVPGSALWRRRRRLGLDPRPEHQYYVFETREAGARETYRAARYAENLLERGRAATRSSHGLTASMAFWDGSRERKRQGRTLVQLHHANVHDAGMNFGLGVPFLISHCRRKRRLAARYEFEQVAWRVDQPDRFEHGVEEIVEAILEDPPAVAGFSLQPWCYERFLDVIRRIKAAEPSITTVVGGSNASIEEAGLMRDVPEIDFLVTGEGEIPFAGLLGLLDGGDPPTAGRIASIGNLFGRIGGELVRGRKTAYRKKVLDHCGSPFQEGLVNLAPNGGNLNVEWTRGCPNHCTYCAWPRSQHTFRRFSAAHIRADVAWAIEKGFGSLLICDASINHSTPLLEDLCATLGEAVGGSDLCFSAFVQWPNLDVEQARLMAGLRWSRLMVGLQTTDDAGLAALGRSPFDRERFEETIRLLRPLGNTYVELMTGVPGDSAEKIRSRVGYVLDLGCRVSVFPLLATKGTIIWKRCLKRGITVDPHHQYVVRDLPTMSFEEYRDVIGWVRGLDLERAVLEIVGYDFLEGSDRQAAEPRSGDLGTDVARLLDRLGSSPIGTWRRSGALEQVRQADLSCQRITFVRQGESLCIDAFRAADLSSPVASGETMAFCPAPGAGGPGVEEASRDICLALAGLDGARR